MKPLVSNKVKSHRILNLIEKDNVIDDDEKIAKIFNEYFVNIVETLGIGIVKSNRKPTEPHLDELNMVIIKYKNHRSIKAVRNRMAELNNPTFSFDFICREEIIKEIDKLCNKKASQNIDIYVNIIKENKNLIPYILRYSFNNSLSCSTFLLP